MDQMDTSNYFESYENLDVHELMLKDKSRNEAYRQAIIDNKSHLKGKTVLDVGTGTGILSILCAQAGAVKVYAVEASNIYKIAQAVVKENNVENIVEVIHSRVEDVNLAEKVDVIVSEWMGFYLLHEAMLDSLITARDKFLKADGLMFPESATLFSAPCSVPAMHEHWADVVGVSMAAFADQLRSEAARKPITAPVAAHNILSDPEVVVWLNLKEVTVEDIGSIKVRHLAVANKSAKYQGICLWFSCLFPSFCTEPVTLSTDPDDPPTHWKQTTIVLPTDIDVEEKTPIAYELVLTKSDRRRYNIEVTMLDPDEIEHPEYCTCHKTKCILIRAMLDNYEKNTI